MAVPATTPAAFLESHCPDFLLLSRTPSPSQAPLSPHEQAPIELHCLLSCLSLSIPIRTPSPPRQLRAPPWTVSPAIRLDPSGSPICSASPKLHRRASAMASPSSSPAPPHLVSVRGSMATSTSRGQTNLAHDSRATHRLPRTSSSQLNLAPIVAASARLHHGSPTSPDCSHLCSIAPRLRVFNSSETTAAPSRLQLLRTLPRHCPELQLRAGL